MYKRVKSFNPTLAFVFVFACVLFHKLKHVRCLFICFWVDLQAWIALGFDFVHPLSHAKIHEESCMRYIKVTFLSFMHCVFHCGFTMFSKIKWRTIINYEKKNDIVIYQNFKNKVKNYNRLSIVIYQNFN